jgi:hypothetical protein
MVTNPAPARRPARREQRRAGPAGRARDDQEVPGTALVPRGTAYRQLAGNVLGRKPVADRGYRLGGRQHAFGRHPQIHHLHVADRRLGIQHQPELAGAHGRGDVRQHRAAVAFAGIGVEARRDVHGHAQGIGRVHPRDGRGRHARDLRVQARAEERIHDHRRPAEPLLPHARLAFRGQVDDGIRLERAQHPQEHGGVACDLRRRQGQEDLHVRAPAEQVSGDDEAVATVLAGAAHDADAEPAELRSFPGDDLGHAAAGVFHQHQAGKP